MTDDVGEWPIGRLLSTAARLVEHSWEARLRAHGLTHAGLIALHCLQQGPMPQRKLAGACRVTDQTISRTLERLDHSGFVTRSLDPRDERRQQVAITKSGRTVLHQIAAVKEADAILASAISDPDQLRRQLVELVTALGDRQIPPVIGRSKSNRTPSRQRKPRDRQDNDLCGHGRSCEGC